MIHLTNAADGEVMPEIKYLIEIPLSVRYRKTSAEGDGYHEPRLPDGIEIEEIKKPDIDQLIEFEMDRIYQAAAEEEGA